MKGRNLEGANDRTMVVLPVMGEFFAHLFANVASCKGNQLLSR